MHVVFTRAYLAEELGVRRYGIGEQCLCAVVIVKVNLLHLIAQPGAASRLSGRGLPRNTSDAGSPPAHVSSNRSKSNSGNLGLTTCQDTAIL
jgi:hypothetical protein